jgi:AhpC/TSA antioxidant enzyme
LRGIAKEAEAIGTLAVVGNGNVAQARDFEKTHGKGLTSLVDHERQGYHALELVSRVNPRRAMLGTLKGIEAATRGFIQGRVQGNAHQLGGTLVLKRGGEPVFFHRADFAGDTPSPKEVLAALKAAAN